MQEVLPGVYHWTARHPRINAEVSSYWLDEDGVLIDPLVPPGEGLDWFAQRPTRPQAVLLSNRHHFREAARFGERFGCSIHCNRAGLHEFSRGEPVVGFEIGDSLPGGIVACELDAICPDDTALYLAGRWCLPTASCAAVRAGQEGLLGFVPDWLMDEPAATERALLAACERLLEELEFEHLLLAHGGPVVGNGRRLLEELVASGGRTAFEM